MTAGAPTSKHAGKNIVDIFVAGAKNGYNMGINNMLPNVVMAYILIRIFNITGILKILGELFAPIMGIFGLPGEGIVVLFTAFLSMGGGAGAAASLHASGHLSDTHVTIIIPAIFLIGAQLQYMGRLLGTIGIPAKYYPPMLGISLLNAVISMFIMRVLVGILG
jgi:spore maturation protein SpmB